MSKLSKIGLTVAYIVVMTIAAGEFIDYVYLELMKEAKQAGDDLYYGVLGQQRTNAIFCAFTLILASAFAHYKFTIPGGGALQFIPTVIMTLVYAGCVAVTVGLVCYIFFEMPDQKTISIQIIAAGLAYVQGYHPFGRVVYAVLNGESSPL